MNEYVTKSVQVLGWEADIRNEHNCWAMTFSKIFNKILD